MEIPVQSEGGSRSMSAVLFSRANPHPCRTAAALCIGTSAMPQSFSVTLKPPAIRAKDAAGVEVATIPLGKGDSVVASAASVDKPIALDFGRGAFASGQVVNVGADRVAVPLTNGGVPLHRVALIDLRQPKVDGVVGTRGAGEKAKLGSSHFGKARRGRAEESGYSGHLHSNRTYQLSGLWLGGASGRTLCYAVDFSTHELAVIDTSTLASATTVSQGGRAS